MRWRGAYRTLPGMMLPELAKQLIDMLAARSQTVTVAESCTGGGVGYALTSVSGSSACFHQGFITYSDAAKTRLLNVDPLILAQFGAVSEQTVKAMAAGAAHAAGSDYAIAVSGVAGPGGGSKDKPVGTVWIAWHDVLGEEIAKQYVFDGDREAVRQSAIQAAIEGLLSLIQKNTV